MKVKLATGTVYYDHFGFNSAFGWVGYNDTLFFGLTAASKNRYTTRIDGLVLGGRDPAVNYADSRRRIYYGSVTPTDAATGEVEFNLTPATGGNLAWACTSGSATAPTWWKAGTVFLDASTGWTPGSVAAGAVVTQTVTVTGAAIGMFAEACLSANLAGLMINACVSAADTVTVTLFNPTAGAIAIGASTVYARVSRR